MAAVSALIAVRVGSASSRLEMILATAPGESTLTKRLPPSLYLDTCDPAATIANSIAQPPFMTANLLQILILGLVQGAAELLPVSSSAHVIFAEKLLGLDPSAPEMTLLLVMLLWQSLATSLTQDPLRRVFRASLPGFPSVQLILRIAALIASGVHSSLSRCQSVC